MAIIDRLRTIVEPLCAELDLEIYDLDMQGGVFRVAVEKPSAADAGGVGLADIAELTRAISRALDDQDPISGKYTLEVTSPGLERPLRTAAHFRRAVSSPVKVKLVPGVALGRRVDGLLVAADDDGFVLRTAGGAEARVGYDQVEKARTVFEWGPTPKPGSTKAGAKPADAKAAGSKQVGAKPAKKQQPSLPAQQAVPSASDDAVKVVNA